jgi:hypothetical protein
MAKRKKQNWDQVRWTPFEEIEPPVQELAPGERRASPDTERWFANSIYVARVRLVESPPPFGVTVHLTVMTHDHQPRHDWRELQWIKNQLVGDAVEAVEIYPSEDRVVDAANHYHLFCFPRLGTERGWLPFGFGARAVSEGCAPDGPRQRDFRPELRPEDVLRPYAPGSQAVGVGPNDTAAGRCAADGSGLVFRSEEPTPQPWNGRLVPMVRGECLKGDHVVFVVPRKELEARAANGGPAAPPDEQHDCG